ncbi:MAG: hypothetical protein GX448_00560 [Planctomycetes bacterium]|nr:hypothetical protein [Planctomycetota bacterium]
MTARSLLSMAWLASITLGLRAAGAQEATPQEPQAARAADPNDKGPDKDQVKIKDELQLLGKVFQKRLLLHCLKENESVRNDAIRLSPGSLQARERGRDHAPFGGQRDLRVQQGACSPELAGAVGPPRTLRQDAAGRSGRAGQLRRANPVPPMLTDPNPGKRVQVAEIDYRFEDDPTKRTTKDFKNQFLTTDFPEDWAGRLARWNPKLVLVDNLDGTPSGRGDPYGYLSSQRPTLPSLQGPDTCALGEHLSRGGRLLLSTPEILVEPWDLPFYRDALCEILTIALSLMLKIELFGSSRPISCSESSQVRTATLGGQGVDMGVKLYRSLQLNQPVMICGWSGIGKVGLVAINTMRRMMRAEAFGEIEPEGFFEPSQAVVVNGVIEYMRFPATRFYGFHGRGGDAVFLVGEQQPADPERTYQMAEMVLDVADSLGCKRIYTAGAGVTTIHHTDRPKVWAVPNTPDLIPEIREYRNTILMSQIEDREGEGSITGLNGLLLGAARSRDMAAVCLMGEVPYYLQGAPWPYPKASISVMEVLGEILGEPLDLHELEETAAKVQANIDHVLDALATADELPEQVREEMESLRHPQHADLGPISEAEKNEILEHIDELFKSNPDHEA